MYIFLGIVGGLATVVGSVAIIINGIVNTALEISKNGYKLKIDKSVLDEYQKRQAEEKKEKTNGIKEAIGVALLFVPGVNLLRAVITNVKLKKFVNDPRIKEALIPMTDKEKEQYAKMEGKMQKLTFIEFIKENEEEAQDKTFVVTHNEEDVQKAIEEIKQSRIDSATKANLESLQAQSIFEQAYVPIETEEVLTEEQQGPVLKKTLKPKRK